MDLTTGLNKVLVAAIQAMFLATMGWVGSIILLRGVGFIKVDRGVGPERYLERMARGREIALAFVITLVRSLLAGSYHLSGR